MLKSHRNRIHRSIPSVFAFSVSFSARPFNRSNDWNSLSSGLCTDVWVVEWAASCNDDISWKMRTKAKKGRRRKNNAVRGTKMPMCLNVVLMPYCWCWIVIVSNSNSTKTFGSFSRISCAFQCIYFACTMGTNQRKLKWYIVVSSGVSNLMKNVPIEPEWTVWSGKIT